MHRVALITKLQNYFSVLEEEINAKKEMIAFIESNTDCFERSLQKGHITASAWLLNKDMSQALLMHHAKLNAWFQLGGHCDGDSDALRVAIKEAQEESGIQGIEAVNDDIFDIDIHLIPENKKEKAHYHYDVRFLLRVNSEEQLIQNKESKELRWIHKDVLTLPTRERSIIRMFGKWITL